MSTGVKVAKTWHEWEGQVVDGQFRLLRYLGGGERSVVYQTERPQGEPGNVAIKLVPVDDLSAEAQLARWKTAAFLSHPHLLRLFEMGRAELGGVSFAYVLMEYAEEDLSQVPRPLTEVEAVDMLGRALEALAYLHSKGLAHGRVKPSNIMAVSDRLKVSSDTVRSYREWNSALDLRQPCDPPEIVSAGASAAGDVWSIGVTLVEAMTKRPPSWETGAVVASLPDGLPGAFQLAVSNCLRHDPQQRWTVADLAKSLQPTVESPLPEPYGSPTTKKLKPRYILTGAIGLTLLAAVIVPRLTSHREALPSSIVEPVAPRQEPVTNQPAAEEVPPKTAVAKPPDPVAVNGIVKQVLPDVPAKARDTIRGKVAVGILVKVDDAGSVLDAKNASPASSRFFSNLALQAARQWKFAPANPDRSAGTREWKLRFSFFPDPDRPVTVQVTPTR
jgi:TonB family protein